MIKSESITQKQLTQVIKSIIAVLRKEDYTILFRREATCLYCLELNELVMPEDFSIDHSYSFQEIDNPDADRVLYAISFGQGRKGYFIDTCNVYSDNISSDMMEKLK
jgi:hypothetical protein